MTRRERRKRVERSPMTSQSNPAGFDKPDPTDPPYYDGPDGHVDRADEDSDGVE